MSSFVVAKRNLLESVNSLVKTTDPNQIVSALEGTLVALTSIVNEVFEAEPGTMHVVTVMTAKKPEE